MMKSRSIGDIVFDSAIIFIAVISLIIVGYPLIFIISSSFSSTEAVVSGKVWLLPVDFSLEGYKAIFTYSQIWTGYWNSIVYTVLSTCYGLLLTICAAYPLYRKSFKPRNVIMAFFTFTMFFEGGIIPTYLLLRNMNMLDTIWVIAIPWSLSVMNIILMRTYFTTTIPNSLLEASQLDGCSDIKFLTLVVLPLSKPIIAVLVLFMAVGMWNGYFASLIYLSSESKFPLQLVLRNILVLNQFDANKVGSFIGNEKLMLERINLQHLMKYSLIIVSILPILVIYPFVQKHLVKGIMIGAVKG